MSVVVISNTIRLTVFARRKEINIMKFVGATNAFIRLPFFVEGMTVGAISGVLATVVVGGAYYGLEQALLQPEALWLNEFMHVAVHGYHLAAAGRVCAVRRRHRRRGLRVQHPQAPEGVIFFEHRSFLWKSIKNWSASYVWCLPH